VTVSPKPAHACSFCTRPVSAPPRILLYSRTDCGNRDDIVSYGKSSDNQCTVPMNTKDTSFGYSAISTLYPPITWNIGDPIGTSRLWRVGAVAASDGFCNARGNSKNLVRTCPFGMDAVDCGHQALTLPRGKVLNREPDNSCATANNGLCEDQLFFSEIAPNDVKLHHLGGCLPNTECVPKRGSLSHFPPPTVLLVAWRRPRLLASKQLLSLR
jgi:hypothetical protein